MKTPLLYGLLIAIATSLLTYGLFFAGFHDSPEKLKIAQSIALWVGLVINISGLALAMRECRTQSPAEKNWGYGSALGAGVLTGLWGSLFGAISFYLYAAFVNPQFCDIAFQAWAAAAQEKGMTGAQLDAASGVMHRIYSPVGLLVFGLVFGFIFFVIEALVVAIFFRSRPETGVTPDISAQPPAL